MTGEGPADRHVVAVIPARGGSKGIEGKNLQLVAGRSLIARAVESCAATDTIDEVVVSTDDARIAAAAVGVGAAVVDRPPELASDDASSESALLHAIDEMSRRGRTPDVLVFVQCTSPFISPDDLDRAVNRVGETCDVAFAAAPSHRFLWRTSEAGVEGVNHDPAFRARRQDRPAEYVETGAFYAMDVPGFVRAGHRFFGRVELLAVDPSTAIEIDEPADLAVARALADELPAAPPLVDVVLLVTDFDGVHTDDRAVIDQNGQEAVSVSRSDGLGIDLLRAAGIPTLIVSRERNPVVLRRAEKLRIECLGGVDDKWPLLASRLRDRGIDPGHVAYVGNDVNDAECMSRVGWPMCPADAHPAAKAVAATVLDKCGGDGAVRAAADLILANRRTP